MSDVLAHVAGLIEQFGHFRLRTREMKNRRGGLVTVYIMDLVLQFEDEVAAHKFADRRRLRVYPFRGFAWTVYPNGRLALFLLAASRPYLCPAHQRIVDMVIGLRGLGKSRRLLARRQWKKSGFSKAQVEGYRKSNEETGDLRDGVMRGLVEAYSRLPEECPIWGALGPPVQRRPQSWWEENLPELDAAYQRRKNKVV